MAKPYIPLRPENFTTSLSQEEQSALTWLVLSGCPRKDAVLTFIRPDMAASSAKPAIKEYIQQFYARKEVKDYLEAYEATINAFIHPTPATVEQPGASLEERKARAKTRAMEFAMDLANHIEDAEDPEVVLKLMDKVGLLDGDEQVEEQPRRYLPVTCSECAYRKFVEENCDDVPDGTDLEGEEDAQ